jgi:hypothetical protein
MRRVTAAVEEAKFICVFRAGSANQGFLLSAPSFQPSGFDSVSMYSGEECAPDSSEISQRNPTGFKMTDNADVTDVLRQLINTNHDGEERGKDATEQPKVAELKLFFRQQASDGARLRRPARSRIGAVG